MAYIIFVNPSILAHTGMDLASVTIATCLCAAFGSILMGALANYPLALAPGMGLNAYFTYTVVLKMGVPWQTALGAVEGWRTGGMHDARPHRFFSTLYPLPGSPASVLCSMGWRLVLSLPHDTDPHQDLSS
jgi:hypothetical protein